MTWWPINGIPLCRPGSHEGPSETFRRRGWWEQAWLLLNQTASQGRSSNSSSSLPSQSQVPSSPTLPLHFPLAQVIGLWVPIGCPLVLAAISHGTKMSMVTLETRQKGHKIQKPYCPNCPSPSKGIVQLWGPNQLPTPPHAQPGQNPDLDPRGPARGEFQRSLKKPKPLG